MIQAFVFIEAKPVCVSKELLSELQDMKLASSVIKHVYGVTGRYDLIALVESPDLAALGDSVTTGIGNAVGVRRTETALIVWPGSATAPAPTASGEVAASSAVYPFEADQRFDAGDKGGR